MLQESEQKFNRKIYNNTCIKIYCIYCIIIDIYYNCIHWNKIFDIIFLLYFYTQNNVKTQFIEKESIWFKKAELTLQFPKRLYLWSKCEYALGSK